MGPATTGRGVRRALVFFCNTLPVVAGERFDPDLLDDQDPFEIDTQAAHLFRHPHLGIEDINDVWSRSSSTFGVSGGGAS